ncbi:aerotolerance protein [Pontibacter qinzhouensis]|uniref:Aerotolerance protein n=1 Tax=Pontibacter qinzhouensis TaxID=2603253 RepID=A0A5C8KAG6_9BACT|nr:aerotolerance protein [Pontibacter qinzhouensis]TXK49257.1 aerotolerance protein [Pontibacter qinzhouensis]
MKPVLLFLFLISLFGGGIRTISQINRYAREAAIAYQQQDFVTAIAAYEHLLNDLEVQDDQISLNLAHAYYKAGLLDKALQQYQQLATHPFQHIRAVAALQTGNIAARRNKFKLALTYYKKALVAEPGNESARYNYELLKKYLLLHPEFVDDQEEEVDQDLSEETPPEEAELPPPATEDLALQPKLKPDADGNREEEIETKEETETGTPENRSQTNAPSDHTTNQNNPNGTKEQEQAAGQTPGDTEGQRAENNPEQGQNNSRSSAEAASEEDQRAQTRRNRLQQMNISPEKAQLLLDAMQNIEMQYIQQLPKKATKKPDPSKPDW